MNPYQRQNRLSRKLADIENDLYSYLFYVTIPEQGSRNIQDIKLFGVHKSTVESYDEDVNSRWINVYIPPAKIADYMHNGVPIKIGPKSDAPKLYELLNEYCIHWADMLGHHLNIGDAPIDDLILYDKVAAAVFDLIKYEADGVLSLPKDVQRLAGLDVFGSGFGGMSLPTPANPDDKSHVSLADIFKRHSSIVRGN